MKTYVLLYDGFIDFEIALTLLLLKKKSEIVTVTTDDRVVPSFGQLKVVTDLKPEDVNPSEVDLLLIPGENLGPMQTG